MFCHSCGRQIPDTAQHCPDCGARQVHGAALATELSGRAKAASQDALQVLKTLAGNPVGGLPPAFEGLGASRALGAGVVFAAVFCFLFALGATIASRRYLGWLDGFFQAGGNSHFMLFLKYLLAALVPVASLVGGCALGRAVLRGTGGIAGDVFTAGAALLPSGLFLVLASLLGGGNVDIVVVLFVFAISTTILMLYSGYAGIARISPPGAALAVPVVLLVSAWLTKVVVAAMW